MGLSGPLKMFSYFFMLINFSSIARGGNGHFKNKKPIGEVGCRESRMAEPIH